MVWGERNSVEGAWSRCKTSTLGARPSGSRVGKNTLKLTDKKGKTSEITAARFVVAVGGRPNRLQIPGGEHAVDSDDIFSLEKAPGRVLCVGAGYIALECGGFTAGLGYPTTCMVRSILLRGFDRECVGKIQTHLEHHGVSLQVGVTPTKIEKDPATGVLTVHGSDGSANQYFHRADRSPTNRGDAAAATRTFPEDESRRGRDVDGPWRRVAATWTSRGGERLRRRYDTVLVATGRKADTTGLGLSTVPGAAEDVVASGKVACVDEQLPHAPHVYAVGDVIDGRPELTPVAIEAGLRLARRLFGGASERMDYENVATTVFTPLE